MRLCVGALVLVAVLPIVALARDGSNLLRAIDQRANVPVGPPAAGVRDVRPRRSVSPRDCRPYNGPYGFYGNPWCDNGFRSKDRKLWWDWHGERRGERSGK